MADYHPLGAAIDRALKWSLGDGQLTRQIATFILAEIEAEFGPIRVERPRPTTLLGMQEKALVRLVSEWRAES